MGFMDALAAAFENDDELGEREDAGLKKRVTYQTITWQGPPPEGMAALFEKPEVKEQQAIPGQKLKDLAEDAGIPLRYSCMQGTCGICDVKVNGVETPACTAKMPKSDCTIEYKASAQAQEYMKEKMKAQAAAKRAAKAAGATGAATPAAAAQKGVVKPTSPFGGNLFEGPFGGNPFGGSMPAVEEPKPELTPLEKRLTEENERKRSKKSGGWPFG